MRQASGPAPRLSLAALRPRWPVWHAADPLVFVASKLQFTRHFQIDDGGARSNWPVTKECDFGPL